MLCQTEYELMTRFYLFIYLFIVQGQQNFGRSLYVPALDKWDDLSVEYQVEWPLHLLFTPEVRSTNVICMPVPAVLPILELLHHGIFLR
jgi:hypothetical protein